MGVELELLLSPRQQTIPKIAGFLEGSATLDHLEIRENRQKLHAYLSRSLIDGAYRRC